MTENITINRQTFAKLTDPEIKPVRFIFRQVGDGPITEYHHTRNDDIHVTEHVDLEPGSLAYESLQSARTAATATGSVGGNWIEQDPSSGDFSLAAQWVREGSVNDVPVLVEA